MKLIQKDGTMSEYIPGGVVNSGPALSVKPTELTEAEQNLPLADRNPKRVLNVKKLWKCNRFGGTL